MELILSITLAIICFVAFFALRHYKVKVKDRDAMVRHLQLEIDSAYDIIDELEQLNNELETQIETYEGNLE